MCATSAFVQCGHFQIPFTIRFKAETQEHVGRVINLFSLNPTVYEISTAQSNFILLVVVALNVCGVCVCCALVL